MNGKVFCPIYLFKISNHCTHDKAFSYQDVGLLVSEFLQKVNFQVLFTYPVRIVVAASAQNESCL